ncbi:MAG: DUF5612 domain-containing protein [Methanobrevibacter sp.]|uniref:DUF5612 domain-containing protein n=1 Tax=Methanobrevibacter sp. TaxID=66852 RepID=UPI0026DEAABD|nr:DUF5612 domain-containing protein [Methanobrevibacter sp.]MDO5848083.1 DUF5612 domain-containing protein [Methanobrevibacter sp.]
MTDYAITIKTDEEKHVLNDITQMLSNHDVNISYTHLFIDSKDTATIDFEVEDVEDIDKLIEDIKKIPEVISVETNVSSNDIYGKRIVVMGGGAQVSQVASGAISEADRHNIRGERIGVDTIPLVGEQDIAEAVAGVARLPRVHALVLAGSLMGGKITESVKKLKEENDIKIISLNMPGSITEAVDLVVTDPTQAGVMAVMAIADTAVFDIDRLKGKNKF